MIPCCGLPQALANAPPVEVGDVLDDVEGDDMVVVGAGYGVVVKSVVELPAAVVTGVVDAEADIGVCSANKACDADLFALSCTACPAVKNDWYAWNSSLAETVTTVLVVI